MGAPCLRDHSPANYPPVNGFYTREHTRINQSLQGRLESPCLSSYGLHDLSKTTAAPLNDGAFLFRSGLCHCGAHQGTVFGV